MARVLILTIVYPPANYVAGRRIEGWVRHLPSFGYSPFVLTRYYDPADQIGGDFMAPGRSPKTLDAPWVETDKVAYTNFTQDLWGKLSIPGKLGGLIFYALPDPRHSGWLQYCTRYVEQMSFKPDVIVASYEPAVVFRVARKLSKKFDVPWVADFRDLWIEKSDRPAGMKHWFQSRHLQSASGITVATDGMADDIKEQLRSWDKPVRVIYNGAEPVGDVSPDPEDAEPLRRFQEVANSYRLTLTYTGTLYPQQNIQKFLDVVESFNGRRDNACAVVLCGRHNPSDYSRWDFVHAIGPIKHNTSLYLQRQSSANFYSTWPSTDSIFSGKIFEQIISGRPVLVAFSPSPDLEAFCRRFGSVHVCKEPEALTNSLERILNAEATAAPDSSFELATKRYWAGEMARFLDEILKRPA